MQKYLNSKNIILFLQAVFVSLIAIGVLPRYYAFFIALTVVTYVFFADQIDAISFAVASIPFYIALPITQNFDTMIYWRILVLEMFVIFVFKYRQAIAKKYREIMSLPGKKTKIKKIWDDYKIEILLSAIFLLAFFSLIGTPNKIVGLKRIIYYANIVILYLVIKYSIKKIDDIKRILKHLGFAAIMFLMIGFAQLVAVYYVGYEKFWQFWSSKIALVFYGKSLSQFVTFNNSWFAFSQSGAPSLRMFSLFWCSLAFAMSMIMMIVVPLSFLFGDGAAKRTKNAIWVFIGFLMMAVILSGSRGAWVSIAFAIGFVLFIASLKKTAKYDRKIYVKRILLMFLLFGVLFPLSPVFLGTRDISSSSVGRIWTVKDTSETSNKARIEIWKTSLLSIKNNPIFGTGVANFSAESDKFSGVWKTTSHNIFLYVAVEAGVPAAILSVIVCFYLFKDFITEFYLADDKFLKMFFLSLSIAVIWVLGYSLIIDSLLTSDKVSLIFATLIGLFYATRKIQQQKRDAIGFGGNNVI